MAKREVDVCTCDRCGFELEGKRGEEPEGWGSACVSSFGGVKTWANHLCAECLAGVRRALAPRARVAEAESANMYHGAGRV